MRKILLPVLVLGIILSMSDCDSNDSKGGDSGNSEYYPYEVTL